MFSVEICLPDEDSLTERLGAMHHWLDRSQFDPTTFYYTFTSPGMLFRVEFAAEAAANSFARKFAGRVIGLTAGALGEMDCSGAATGNRDASHETFDDDDVEEDAPSGLEALARDIREGAVIGRERKLNGPG